MDAEDEVKQERVITLRPLNMQDFKEAKNQVRLLYAWFICIFDSSNMIWLVLVAVGDLGFFFFLISLLWIYNLGCLTNLLGRRLPQALQLSEMNELRQWNELHGEGGSRKQQQLSYFLWEWEFLRREKFVAAPFYFRSKKWRGKHFPPCRHPSRSQEFASDNIRAYNFQQYLSCFMLEHVFGILPIVLNIVVVDSVPYVNWKKKLFIGIVVMIIKLACYVYNITEVCN